MPLPAIAAGAMRIGSMFARGAGKGGGLLRKSLQKKAKMKRESIARDKVLNKRIGEKRRRREKETLLETFKTRGKSGMSPDVPGKSFLERVLEFIGVLLIGWLVDKLPQIIQWVKDFIERAKLLIKNLESFVSNLGKWFKSIGSVVSAHVENFLNFDFNDKSGKVDKAMKDLGDAFKGMKDDLKGMENAIKSSMGKPREGDFSGDTSEDKTMNYLMSQGLTQQQAAGIAGNLKQESGFNPKADNTGEGEGGAGHYGIAQWDKKDRWPKVKKWMLDNKLDPYSLEGQLKAMMWEAEKRGDLPKIRQTTTAEESAKSWLKNFERSGEKPGEAGYENRIKYARALGSKQISGATLGTAPSQEGLPALPPTDTLGGGAQRYGASRDGGSRKHAGVDFDISGNEKFYSRIGGVVVGSPFRYGADGLAIDIYNQQLGVYERIAEARNILVKPGQKVQPGQAVVQGESGTGVIHYEIRKKIEGGFENSVDPIAFLRSAKSGATIARTPTASDVASNISMGAGVGQPQNTVMIIEEEAPPPMMMGGSGGSSPVIVMGESLNSIIKKQLLTSLAYT